VTITGSLATEKAEKAIVMHKEDGGTDAQAQNLRVVTLQMKSTVCLLGGEIVATVTIMHTVAFPGMVALLVAHRGAAGK
jgi:hypothetical protein